MFSELIHNPFMIIAISSWMIAQTLKCIIHAIINKKFDISRLIGDGGMPSGHSATVMSMAVLTMLEYGAQSFEFAICAIFAIIVFKDATGVRMETGKQSMVINEMMKTLEHLPEIKLKEFVGHTPIQVLGGILVGTLNALAGYYWYLPCITA